MTEPTASPDVTAHIELDEAAVEVAVRRTRSETFDALTMDEHKILVFDVLAAYLGETAELLALRQEVERLTRERDEERHFSEQTRAQYENLEASLRLATQRREDVVEALRGLDITDAELLRIRNNCEIVDQNGMIEIWAMMLQKLVDHVRDLRALALQPKEN